MRWRFANVTKFWALAMTNVLQQIRDMQFQDKSSAEALLLSFFRDELGLDVVKTHLTPKPTSLNSFNGFVWLADGQHKFFKTHTESNTVITEYYNADMLAKAGYPIILPTFQSTQTGKQLLIYDVISDEAVFDVAWQLENHQRDDLDKLTQAQNSADKHLLEIYQDTLQPINPEENTTAPIHQLFHHRLTKGRLQEFYFGQIELPNGVFAMDEVKQWQWIINGQVYQNTLGEIIDRAIAVLNPNQSDISVIGHGDAHNGNVFYRSDNTLLYFDPAFAGRHHPLLDLTKPLFHNVFAMWMYYTKEKHHTTPISIELQNGVCIVNYDYALAPVRQMFFDSKVQNTLIPILKILKQKQILKENWREFLKLALFCCPFLTMNLADRNKFSSNIGLLGLAMSIEMGAESMSTLSILDKTLNFVAENLG
jgi:hypothetical protein